VCSSDLGLFVYADIQGPVIQGVNDLEGRRVTHSPLPGRLTAVYQIPLRPASGLATSPYAAVLQTVPPASFPMLAKLMPIIKGLSAELENMRFRLTARPIFSGEGAVRIVPRYPEGLANRPFTVIIDDVVIENIDNDIILREGERHLVILSEDYRNESRRFIVERARVIDLVINLQDTTPLIIFEAPDNALVFLNGVLVTHRGGPIAVEEGLHEVRFELGDYTLIRNVRIERGRTYRIAAAVDISIDEMP
jgi:hypothetical protein